MPTVEYQEKYPGMSEEEFNLIIHVLGLYAEGYLPQDDFNFSTWSKDAKQLEKKMRSLK